VPSVLHEGYYISRIGIQNIENETVNLTLHFYDSTGVEKVTISDKSIDAQGSYIFQIIDDEDNIPGIGSSFNGSLVIEAAKGDGSPARVVAAVEDLQSQGQRSYAYEGSSATAKTFYLPYANCRYSTNRQSTVYYVQNAGTADASITVYYYTTGGTSIAYYTPAAKIKPGARMLVSACDSRVYTRMNGKNGTARITSSTQPLVVIGKVTSNNGLSTAFLGRSSGGKDILLPYVEYSKLSSSPRASLSIMNVSSGSATSIYIKYWYKKIDGTFAYQKVTVASSSAPLRRYGKYTAAPRVSGAALDANGNYLGAAEVVSNANVVVVVRTSQTITGIPGITTLGEDYTGVPYGP